MKITFLGASHGVPEANRRCSSTLIEAGNKRYIIDMGTQSVEVLRTKNIPIESISGIFITHMHGDHTNGLISFVDLCSWYFKGADPDIFLPAPMDRSVDALRGWLECNGVPMREFRFHEVSEGVIWDDGVIKITAFRTKHTAVSYAYLVEGEGKRVLFSGDLSHKGPEDDFPVSVLEIPLDLAICEAAHFSAEKYLPIFEKTDNLKQLCFNHCSGRFYETALAVKRMIDIPTYIANDGMEINL